ncbi:MAG: hypothetical protein ACTHYJ_09755 [Brevibacterium yomogidense]
MNVGVLAFIVAAAGFVALLIGAIVVVLWLIRRSRPGRAPAPAGHETLDGVIRCVLVTTVPRSRGQHQDDNDQRRVSVLIDVESPHGRSRIVDQPERPKYLPWILRWRIFTKNPFRYGDLQLLIDDPDERRLAADAARAGGYEFRLEEPLRVLVTDTGGQGRRPRWRLADAR